MYINNIHITVYIYAYNLYLYTLQRIEQLEVFSPTLYRFPSPEYYQTVLNMPTCQAKRQTRVQRSRETELEGEHTHGRAWRHFGSEAWWGRVGLSRAWERQGQASRRIMGGADSLSWPVNSGYQMAGPPGPPASCWPHSSHTCLALSCLYSPCSPFILEKQVIQWKRQTKLPVHSLWF